LAGQISGVEGYVESIASGLLTALVISESLPLLPAESLLGQIWRRLITPDDKRRFQPVNANFGILPALENPPRDKKLKKEQLSQRALNGLQDSLAKINIK
ncbi:MAG: FAD-dependent oxidoreductase, partial [Candidatus Cloacimonetes bacterium]|nr:FAD-dependent oxidoreductase [Candidatus Cloacimonadota bacterium]